MKDNAMNKRKKDKDKYLSSKSKTENKLLNNANLTDNQTFIRDIVPFVLLLFS